MLSEADAMEAVIGKATQRDRDVWQAGRIYERCLAAEGEREARTIDQEIREADERVGPGPEAEPLQDGGERELERAYERDVRGPSGPNDPATIYNAAMRYAEEGVNRTWYREGFEAGWRAVEPIRAALEDCVKWMRRARSGNLFADEKRRAQFEASRLRGVAALASSPDEGGERR